MTDRLKLPIQISAVSLMIIILFSAQAFGLYSEYAGSITDNLLSPTSIHVSDDQIAVLEPFKKQITVFTPDGTLTNTVDLDSNAFALARIGLNDYVFCDTERKSVVQVNIQNGYQSQLLPSNNLSTQRNKITP